MIHLIIIGCGKAKALTARPAWDLYTGSLFKAAWAYARAHQSSTGATLRIASAKYGLVDPMAMIEPYDLKLTKTRARPWREKIRGQLAEQFGNALSLVTVLAGSIYTWEIKMVGQGRFPVQEPLQFKTLGQRMAWFKEQRLLCPERYPKAHAPTPQRAAADDLEEAAAWRRIEARQVARDPSKPPKVRAFARLEVHGQETLPVFEEGLDLFSAPTLDNP